MTKQQAAYWRAVRNRERVERSARDGVLRFVSDMLRANRPQFARDVADVQCTIAACVVETLREHYRIVERKR